MTGYLTSSEYIDWQKPEVADKAKSLAKGLAEDAGIVRSCFHFVRDKIKHSWDYKLNPVTAKASDVLKHGTGYCYAKSHLLAALCYQRLTIEKDQPPFCVHGLNAVYLKDYGWYRIDARGNKAEVEAEFCPPKEQLAFPIVSQGEGNFPELYAEPLDVVIKMLNNSETYLEVSENLPDMPIPMV